jgi:error-prone DNA polymerase
MTSYAELHCITNFTFLRGASHPHELVERAKALGYEALAITDECSMAGVVRAHEAARKLKLKLIVGSEFRTSDGLHLVLLAPTQNAYAQICAVITAARIDSPKGEYRLTRTDLEVDLSECLALWIPDSQVRLSQAGWLREKFPQRCWIAVELHRQPDDADRLLRLQQCGHVMDIPLVAAGDVHMHVRERRALQDTVTAIRHGCTLEQAGHRLFPNAERHLRTCDDLICVYPRSLLEESVRIAERCRFSLDSLQYRYPHELVREGSATEYLRKLTMEGVNRRWPSGVPAPIRATIEKELALIRELGYEHFFLTVYDIVDYARHRCKPPILCQGRGSAANSVVCYALGVTEVSPEKANLLFERFLSKERGEPPDIDVDFEHERREEVIQYVFNKYGRRRTALAATVITYRTRSAVRDIGKALGLDADLIDRIAKAHVYWDRPEAFQSSLDALGLRLSTAIAQRFCMLIGAIRNFPRHLSQHVGGFVISEEPISDLVPIENASMPERRVIQWDKADLETLGLLKVDVLALGMLTAMRKAFDLSAKTDGWPARMDQVPDNDEKTYDMICAADTIGVFQIESRAQMSMLPRLRPRDYYDLVIEVAIVRPGPIKGGMVHPFLRARERARSAQPIEYPSEELRPILAKTFGVPIFQEQVMQIAMVAAGYSAGEADELRRAMGAWQRSGKMGAQREKLMEGLLKGGYTQEFAERIYKQIEGFGEYGFPESHAASFALLTYQSSWLKRHRPAAFFAALINSQPMGFYQPAQLLEQAKRQNVEIRPIDVTRSEWDCTLETIAPGNHAIRLGMRLVKGLRKPEADRIVVARQSQQFTCIEDLAARAGIPKRALNALANGGTFRSIAEHRNEASWSALGIERLPGMLESLPSSTDTASLPAPTEWEEIQRDYRQLGFSSGRHPLALLRSRLRQMGLSSRRELNSIASGRSVIVAGMVTHLQHPQTANGVIFASLEDETGINNVIFWPKLFESYRHKILQSNLMLVEGELQNQEGVVHVVATRVDDLTSWVRTLPRNSRDFH